MARKHCQTREFRDSSQADDHTVFDQDRDHSAMTISDHCVDVNKREIARQYIYCQTRELNNNHNGAEMRETQELTILHKQLCATLTKSSSSKQSTTHELSRNCKNSVPVEMNTDCEISELDSDDYPRNGIEVNVKTIESRKALPTSKVVVQIKNGSSAVDEENLNVSVLNVGTLWKQFIHEQKEHMNAKWREEQLQTALLHQQMEFKHLLIEYNSLLQKYAKAENIIDSLKLLRELKNTNESKTAINEQNCARTPMLQSSITFSDDGDLSNFSLTSDDSRLFQAQKDKSEVQQTGHDDYILPG